MTGAPTHRFLYVSSAGVYAASTQWPLDETAAIDPASRHSGKADTEQWLQQQGIPFTSFRPTYIVGPGNYNPVERWFFDRIVNNRPIPLPGSGETITQIGHAEDLAEDGTHALGDGNVGPHGKDRAEREGFVCKGFEASCIPF